ARRLHVSEETLIWNNVDLEELLASGEPNRFDQILAPGTVIRVPHVEGILHTVETDETVTEIADRYQVEPRDILEFEPNGLGGDPNNLEPGSTILVPGGQPPLGPASSSAAVEWA